MTATTVRAPSRSRLRVLVLGYIVRGPLGGLVWHHLQYMLGLAALGHDVLFLEDSDDYAACYDPSSGAVGTDPTYGLAFIKSTFEAVGLGDRWAYFDAHLKGWHGPAADTLRSGEFHADLLLNVSGINPLRDWTASVPRRVLIDTDPTFTQVRHLTDAGAHSLASRHTHFFSFGENFGKVGCSIPDDGFDWRATRQPVSLAHWREHAPNPDAAYSTVMQWDSYKVVQHDGREFGMKSSSFPPYMDLPSRSVRRFQIAMGSATAPRAVLSEHGWQLLDPLAITRDAWAYQQFIADSRAEFSVAKAGYVDSRSGWFSERSAGYLASGRPVVVQDTDFGKWLSCDDGVLMFSTPEEALAQLARLDRDYAMHCRAARHVANEYFSADRVLSSLIEEVMSDSKESL